MWTALSAVVAVLALAAASLPLAGQDAASSERFRLAGAMVPAAGRSASPSFRLTACLCGGIAGCAESASFRVLAGCAALIPDALERRPGPDPGPRSPEERSTPSPDGVNDRGSGAAARK